MKRVASSTPFSSVFVGPLAVIRIRDSVSAIPRQASRSTRASWSVEPMDSMLTEALAPLSGTPGPLVRVLVSELGLGSGPEPKVGGTKLGGGAFMEEGVMRRARTSARIRRRVT
jgi:hypothetical protein